MVTRHKNTIHSMISPRKFASDTCSNRKHVKRRVLKKLLFKWRKFINEINSAWVLNVMLSEFEEQHGLF